MTTFGTEFPELFNPPWMLPDDQVGSLPPGVVIDFAPPGYQNVAPPAGEEAKLRAADPGLEVPDPEDAAEVPAE